MKSRGEHRPLRVAQVSFHADEKEREPESLLRAWPTLLGVAAGAASAGVEVTVVQAASRHQTLARDDVGFRFVQPRRIIDTVVALRPDAVHVQGFHHTTATRQLMTALPGVPVLVQDHAGAPPRSPRALAWRWAYRSLAGAVFAVREQAEPFIAARVLSARLPLFEVVEGSTRFTPGDRDAARRTTGIHGDPCFLWTGHLDANKDPLTTLEAFRLAAVRLPDARLWCCFGKAPLLERVQHAIADSPLLAERVVLLGSREHERMEHLLRAADFFVQTSHREGCSYSTIEALACGTTPLVTDIPSSRRIVGHAGSLTPVGDAVALAEAMVAWTARDPHRRRAEARARFDAALSFDVIGRDLSAAYHALAARS
jgi:glycosyltransferase involved in cell wall biosynthesis